MSVGRNFWKNLARTRGNDDKTLAALWESLLTVREGLANDLNKGVSPNLEGNIFSI